MKSLLSPFLAASLILQPINAFARSGAYARGNQENSVHLAPAPYLPEGAELFYSIMPVGAGLIQFQLCTKLADGKAACAVLGQPGYSVEDLKAIEADMLANAAGSGVALVGCGLAIAALAATLAFALPTAGLMGIGIALTQSVPMAGAIFLSFTFAVAAPTVVGTAIVYGTQVATETNPGAYFEAAEMVKESLAASIARTEAITGNKNGVKVTIKDAKSWRGRSECRC